MKNVMINAGIRITLSMFLFSISFASDQVPAKKQERPIALVGGTIHTVTNETIENGSILFIDGKIEKIGVGIDFPPKTEQIDITGKHVYPGIINADTYLGLVEINSVAGTRDHTELGSMNPNVRAEVAINPDSELLPVTRSHGITVVNSVPRGGRISGKSAAIMLDGWTWEDMTLKAPVGMHMTWPRMTLLKVWWDNKSEEDQVKERKEAFEQIAVFIADAKAYKIAKEASGKKGIPDHEVDLRLEAMIPVLNKELPLWINAEEIQQIQSAVDWAEAEGINPVVFGGNDSWMVADELKEMDIPVVIRSVHSTPIRDWEAYDSRYTLANKLYEAGIKFCIAHPTTHGDQQNIRYSAAMAVAFGLPEAEGLRSITIYAAEIMGISDRVGSLETGKDATLIVTDGNPLEIRTNVEMEFIMGKKIDLDNKHKRLFRKYTEKYKQKGLIK